VHSRDLRCFHGRLLTFVLKNPGRDPSLRSGGPDWLPSIRHSERSEESRPGVLAGLAFLTVLLAQGHQGLKMTENAVGEQRESLYRSGIGSGDRLSLTPNP
jgi:hypothetical protein